MAVFRYSSVVTLLLGQERNAIICQSHTSSKDPLQRRRTELRYTFIDIVLVVFETPTSFFTELGSFMR